MDEIAALTGAVGAISDLHAWLLPGRIDLEPVRVLKGPSGCGKSHLARTLTSEVGNEFVCVIACGDPAITTRDLLPFDAVYSTDVVRALTQIVPDLASVTPYGSAVKPLLQLVLAHHELHQTNLTRSLGQPQRDILFQLQRRVGRRRLLLIMDSVHSWDAASLQLLQTMWSPQQSAAFPFLSRTSYLAVITPDDPIAAPDSFNAAFNSIRPRITLLHRPPRA
ncbi:MAG: hypothetical protein QOD51_707, partial [Candidatus Eremiobacteraeota bacterium]|nr:hypothetical protein [Candidatus Eremiobacteraeota bacterium]